MTPVWSHFCPHGHNLLHTKYQGIGFSDKDIFYIFCKTCGPWAVPFWPHWHNLNKLHRGPLDDAINQITRLYALWFQTRIFFIFSSQKSIFSQCDLDNVTCNGPEPFGPLVKRAIWGSFLSSLVTIQSVVWSNCWRRTTDIQWSQPMAQVS